MKKEKNFSIPYGRQFIDKQDINSVIKTLKSDYLTQGPKVDELEEKFSSLVKSKYCVAVNSATSGLHIAQLALGIDKKSIVWTTSNTFVATSNTALLCGAKIDFVDIDQKTNNISIPELRRKLIKAKDNNCLPDLVIPVHLTGLSCDMREIFKLSKEFNFKIIEDASHAIGAKYQNENVGCCSYSDMAVFSLHPVKIVTSGEGGLITTNSESIYKKLLMLRSHGITKSKNDFRDSFVPDWYYQQQNLGLNYRMTDISASLCISQLDKLDDFIKKRHQIANFYDERLDGDNFEKPCMEVNKDSSFHLYVVKIPKNRDKLLFYLKENGIYTTLHYYPVYLQPFYEALDFKKGINPLSEKYGHEALSLPIYPDLKLKDLKKVVEILNNFFNK